MYEILIRIERPLPGKSFSRTAEQRAADADCGLPALACGSVFQDRHRGIDGGCGGIILRPGRFAMAEPVGMDLFGGRSGSCVPGPGVIQ